MSHWILYSGNHNLSTTWCSAVTTTTTAAARCVINLRFEVVQWDFVKKYVLLIVRLEIDGLQ